jgi:pimeloyl-ACP methyl ester carboxylesterase
MSKQKINTTLGKISVTKDYGGDGPPIVFMHGVFLDKTLWSPFDSTMTGRTHIYIDMPSHGESECINRDWSLDECVTMLIEILDYLEIPTCIAVGQSWGSMTALRAAIKFPNRFSALCLCNMPFQKTIGIKKIWFQVQKHLTRFPRFYAGQAAKSLYSKHFLQQNPEYIRQMQERLAMRSGKELSRIIDAVIIYPSDATEMILSLQTPALAIVGESDYVGHPPRIKTTVVPGGHISPHESPLDIKQAILHIITIERKTD